MPGCIGVPAHSNALCYRKACTAAHCEHAVPVTSKSPIIVLRVFETPPLQILHDPNVARGFHLMQHFSIISDRSQAEHTGVILSTFSTQTRRFAAMLHPSMLCACSWQVSFASCLNISRRVCGSRSLIVLCFKSMCGCNGKHSHLQCFLQFICIKPSPTHCSPSLHQEDRRELNSEQTLTNVLILRNFKVCALECIEALSV